MTIQCEQFVFGYFPDKKAIRLIKTRNLTQQVNEATIIELCRQGGGLETEHWTYSYLPTENLIAVTYLKPTKDDHGRNGVWNNTLFIKVLDYLKLSNPIKLFKPYTLHSAEEVPKNLEPINVSTVETLT